MITGAGQHFARHSLSRNHFRAELHFPYGGQSFASSYGDPELKPKRAGQNLWIVKRSTRIHLLPS